SAKTPAEDVTSISRTPSQIIHDELKQQEPEKRKIESYETLGFGKSQNTAEKKDNALLCQMRIIDPSERMFDSPLVKQVNLKEEECDELIGFLDLIAQRRQEEERQQQEDRSAVIADKIYGQLNGQVFFEEQNIKQNNDRSWSQSITIVKENSSEEFSQPLNFFNPQHSWILESFLSHQANSWMVRRFHTKEDQLVFQVSFGFPDQTYIESEGLVREEAIVLVAEDLYHCN
ncbi:MAG TPA: hypothetical protein V6C96_00180, partial [Vampirovibrionales bacterium]